MKGEKLYYRIGEVSEKADLRPSVLRFWESEFPQLSPVKSSTGQRLYSRRDVELILEIKKLLYQEKLTIDGARRRLLRRGGDPKEAATEVEQCRQVLGEIRQDLIQLRKMLY